MPELTVELLTHPYHSLDVVFVDIFGSEVTGSQGLIQLNTHDHGYLLPLCAGCPSVSQPFGRCKVDPRRVMLRQIWPGHGMRWSGCPCDLCREDARLYRQSKGPARRRRTKEDLAKEREDWLHEIEDPNWVDPEDQVR